MQAWRRLRHWSMPLSITLCSTPTRASIRFSLKSSTSCTFSGRLAGSSEWCTECQGRHSSRKNICADCEDFRGIAVSPIVSKLFEYCLKEKFTEFLQTNNNQFGFKKRIGCNRAIYTVRNVVERFTKGGDTVNLCAIDLSEAFDKVNHHALFIKLMRRNLPVALLDIPEKLV